MTYWFFCYLSRCLLDCDENVNHNYINDTMKDIETALKGYEFELRIQEEEK